MKKNPRNFWKLGKEEFNTQFLDVSKKGELVAREGLYQYNIRELAKKHGSPLEIVFPHIVESRVRRLIDLFSAYIKLDGYRGKFYYHYPMKVNQGKEFVLPLVTEGANLETSSANELWIVKRMWEAEQFASRIRVLCNGPKTEKYLKLIDELDRKGLIITPIIEEERELAFFKQYKGEVGIRVNMDIKVKSHWDKRFNYFGFPEDEILAMGKIRNLGVLSYHISSQIQKVEGLTAPIRRAVALYAKMREKNPMLDTINIGGGAGVPYEKRRFYSVKAAIQQIVRTFKTSCQKLGVREPNIICEWGRYVAAPAQMSVFKVLTEKLISNGHSKRWYIIDGSFINDLADTWAIHQKWHVVPVSDLSVKGLQKVWLAGSSCDSDDKYTAGGSHVLLPKFEDDGDLYVAVLDTGAYQDSLASYHCLLSHPAKLIAQNGSVSVVRKRETPEDIGKKFGW
jgi:arginine decarboxylase